MRPFGSDHERTVDVRFVAATHRDLSLDVAEKRFREDLYYRLKVLEVRVPALRDRTEDLPALVDHFFQRALGRNPRSPVVEIGAEAFERLRRAAWPGNVRELSAVVERLVVFGKNARIEASDLENLEPASSSQPPPPEEILTLRRLSERHVETVLAKTAGDKVKAAALLGVDLSTLYRWKRRGQAE
jgi:two-component system response regulator HydG